MHDLIALILHLAGLYVALGVMVIGFVIMIGGLGRAGGVMLFGQSWVGSTARFLFVRPVVAIVRGTGRLVWQALSLIGSAAARCGRLIIDTLIDPVLLLIGRLLRRIFLLHR